MSKEKSFWDWIFVTSCCGERDKDKTLATRQQFEQEFDDQPESVFKEVDLHKDSVSTEVSGKCEQEYNE